MHLRDASLYPRWYGEEHAAPELLGTFVYGLPELFRYEVQKAKAVAVPGCYPTAAGLALAGKRDRHDDGLSLSGGNCRS